MLKLKLTRRTNRLIRESDDRRMVEYLKIGAEAAHRAGEHKTGDRIWALARQYEGRA